MPTHDAVADVLVQHTECHPIQRSARGRDLSQHIHAVAILLDHPRDAADLAFCAR